MQKECIFAFVSKQIRKKARSVFEEKEVNYAGRNESASEN
jgi:hypothetical protein